MTLAAIDFETTGLVAGYHEPIQIAVVPLDSEFRPTGDSFVEYIRPEFPERQSVEAMQVNAIDLRLCRLSPARVSDLLVEWWEHQHGQLTPLAHNWAFEYSFLNAWLGVDLTQHLFSRDAIDTKTLASAMRWAGHDLGRSASLGALCQHFGIINERAHDAYADCVAEGELFGKLTELLTP